MSEISRSENPAKVLSTKPRLVVEGGLTSWDVGAFLVGMLGLGLLIHAAWASSATYDEVTYLEVATTWWRTGSEETISRMGSPLTFWKLQQAATLWLLDRSGFGGLIDQPIEEQATLLPILRIGALWIWICTLVLTTFWGRSLYGPKAGFVAATLFVLSPNLLAHAGLITMELPLVLGWLAATILFSRFLETGRRRWFLGSGLIAGVTFSCKFTTVILPIVLGLAWLVTSIYRDGRERSLSQWIGALLRIGLGMIGYGVLMLGADLVITGGALITFSPRVGEVHPTLSNRFGAPWDQLMITLIETPLPQDWVAFGNQLRMQRSGGLSYLFGERRMQGWWYYYLVALAVKVPLGLLLFFGTRTVNAIRQREWRQPTIPGIICVTTIGFLILITALASSRNYGVRYLLPTFPFAILWISGLVSKSRITTWITILGLTMMTVAVATTHPHYLSFFNQLAGGTKGGRLILADSNLDWGQGARSLARLQQESPKYRDLTFYTFGNTDPSYYGVVGRCYVIDAHGPPDNIPPEIEADTTYVPVSASLQHGPWSPAGYFQLLDRLEPACYTDDVSIAIYQTDQTAVGLNRPVQAPR